jgi:hypothetical protein
MINFAIFFNLQAENLATSRLNAIGHAVTKSMRLNVPPSVTTDIWSSKSQDSYLSFTLHLIQEDFTPVMYSLGTVPIVDQPSHTS